MAESQHKHLPHLPPFASEPIVFFTVVSANREAIFNNDNALDILRSVWTRSAEQNGWWVGNYILMPDHVHFFARASRVADSMKKWVQMWKSVSARELIKRNGLKSPVWQKEYFDRFLRSGDDYSEKWVYVEANPVRAGYCKNPEDWPYRGQIHELRF